MTIKRELIRRVKEHKKDSSPLSPSECDELILLLGGTVRTRHRPEVKILGINRRKGNWAALGNIVYRAFYQAEQLAELEAKLKTETEPYNIAELERVIDALKPMCAKNETEAIHLAVDQFNRWGTTRKVNNQYVSLDFGFIQREVTKIKKEAGNKCKGKLFWLNEWLKLKEEAELETQIKLDRMTDNLHS